jgi:outer membrane protein assembly factor BamB
MSGMAGTAVGQRGESWPQFGYDSANTGHAPANAGPVGDMGEQWRFETGGPVYSWPAVVDGTVYVGSLDGNVYGLDAESGSEEWRFATGEEVQSSPAVVDGTVYVGSLDGNVYGLDAGSGTEEWRFETGMNVFSSPAVVDGTVYVVAGDVYGVAAGSGAEVWRFETADQMLSPPAVMGGTVYVGSHDGHVYGLDAESGEERWRFETDGYVYSSPAVVDGTVYVGSDDDNVYALDAESGSEEWRFELGEPVYTSPAVVDETVYVGSSGGQVYGLAAESGSEEWRFEMGTVVFSSPAVVDGTVYVGGDDHVYGLAAGSGTEEWRFEIAGGTTSPAVVDGTVYVGGWDHNVYAITGETPTPTRTPTSQGQAAGGGAGSSETDGASGDGSSSMLPVAGGLAVLAAGGGLWYRRRNGGDSTPAPSDSSDDDAPSGPGAVVRREVTLADHLTAAAHLRADAETALAADDPDRALALVERARAACAAARAAATTDGEREAVTERVDELDALQAAVDDRRADGREDAADSAAESVDPERYRDRVQRAIDGARAAAADGAFDDALDRLDAAIDDVGAARDRSDADRRPAIEPLLADLREERERVADRRDACEEIAGEVDRIAARLDVLREQVDEDPETALSALDDLDSALATLEARAEDREFEDVGARIATLRERSESVRAAASEVRDHRADVAADLASVRSGVEAARDRLDAGAVEAANERIGDLIERIEDVRARADEHDIEEQATVATALREELADLRAAVEARRETRQAVDRLAARVGDAEDRLDAGDHLTALSAFDRLGARAQELRAEAEERGDGEARTDAEVLAVRCRAGWRAARRGLDRRATERLTGRLDAAARRLARVRSDLPEGSTAALHARLDEVTDALDAVESTARAVGDDDLRDRVSGLRAEVRACRDGLDVREALDDHRDRVQAAFDCLDRGEYGAAVERFEAGGADLDALAERIDDLGLDALDAAVGTLRERCREGAARATELAADRPPRSIPGAPDVAVTYADLERQELLGKGGNADVYLVTTPEGCELAVKEPRVGGTLHVEMVERLMREAETWDKLDDHDHVVGVVDYGSQPLPWIAMEYMDAGDLGDRTGEMAFEQALWVATSITGAVRHAHRRGVAHLDLKPANVLFRSVERGWDVPKVADWGLSKHLLDHSKSIEGLSPQYAAPEQFDESYGSTDDITDVYQLGSVFYDLFVGRPPFEGRATKVMRRVLDEEPAPPSEVADVPSELDDVLLTALAKEKADRFESVLYLRDALRQLGTD